MRLRKGIDLKQEFLQAESWVERETGQSGSTDPFSKLT